MKTIGLILICLISISCNKSGKNTASNRTDENLVQDVKDVPNLGEIQYTSIKDRANGRGNCEQAVYFSKYLQSKNDHFVTYVRKQIKSTSVELPLLKKLDKELNIQDLTQIDESILKNTAFDSNLVAVEEGDILIGSVDSNYDAIFAMKILGDVDGCLDIEYKLLKFGYK
jgi:hypothetical protein